MRLVEQDGKFYRVRRGKLVQIPDEWVGNTVHKQTIRKRLSKMSPQMAADYKCLRAGLRRSYVRERERYVED